MSAFETFLLTDLEISFVSACPQGANPGAKVMLKKENILMAGEDTKTPVNVTLDMDALSKSLSENLGKVMTDLMAKDKNLTAEAMTEAVVAVVAGDIAKVGKDLNDQLTKVVTDLQKDVDAKMAKAKADAEDVSKSGEETLTLNGTIFKKSVVGEGAFLAIKASAMQQDALRKEIEDQKLLGRVEKEYPNIAGKPADKAALLGLIEKADEAVKATGLAVLKALNDAGAEFKKEDGKGSGDPGVGSPVGKMSSDTDAGAKLDQMAKDLAQKEGISVERAYAKVLDTPEGDKLYNQHRGA